MVTMANSIKDLKWEKGESVSNLVCQARVPERASVEHLRDKEERLRPRILSCLWLERQRSDRGVVAYGL
jgi:hypothetical protein